ncbi:MAG: glycerophosphodiester phosphodiesterase family protein [Roseburia sp.]
MEINTWTVNDLALMKKLQEFQVHGVITNFPDRVKKLQREV